MLAVCHSRVADSARARAVSFLSSFSSRAADRVVFSSGTTNKHCTTTLHQGMGALLVKCVHGKISDHKCAFCNYMAPHNLAIHVKTVHGKTMANKEIADIGIYLVFLCYICCIFLYFTPKSTSQKIICSHFRSHSRRICHSLSKTVEKKPLQQITNLRYPNWSDKYSNGRFKTSAIVSNFPHLIPLLWFLLSHREWTTRDGARWGLRSPSIARRLHNSFL